MLHSKKLKLIKKNYLLDVFDTKRNKIKLAAILKSPFILLTPLQHNQPSS